MHMLRGEKCLQNSYYLERDAETYVQLDCRITTEPINTSGHGTAHFSMKRYVRVISNVHCGAIWTRTDRVA